MKRRTFVGGALAGVAGGVGVGVAAAAGEMPRRRLGRTGVEVSMLGLGGHHIGRPKDEKEGIRLVQMAIDNGITFLFQQAIEVGRTFKPLTTREREALLSRTAPLAAAGKYEPFKNTARFDGTAKNRHWLDTARL